MKKIMMLVLVVVIGLVMASTSFGAVPLKMSVQGKLTADDKTSPKSMTFGIYNVSTGGVASWEETQSVPLNDQGIFNAIIGGNPIPIPTTLSGPGFWMGIKIGAAELLPRQQIVSVPFALRAGEADSAVGWSQATGNTTTSNNVGIGTSEPTATLEVNGTIKATGNISTLGYLKGKLISMESDQISSMFNIGLRGNYYIDGNYIDMLYNAYESDGNYYVPRHIACRLKIGREGYSFQIFGQINQVYPGPVTFTEIMKIDASGVVVNGPITATNLGGATSWTRSGANLYNTNTGNVGIGTTSPGAKLEVTGNISVCATTASNMGVINIGNKQIHSFGVNNLFMGNNAGNFTLTGNGRNVGIGDNALSKNTTGQYNTAVGCYSFSNNTTGNNNTAVGHYSLYSNTSGVSNTACGQAALMYVSTGSYNTAIGEGAGQINSSTSTGCTFIGYMANPTTNGLTNATAIGYQAQVGISNAIVLGGTQTLAVKVGIGYTSPSYTLHVNGAVAGFGAYVNTSDERLKKNIKVLPNALDSICKLNGVSFDWRRDEYKDKNMAAGKQIGVIAQNVEKVYPEIVSTDKEGYKSVASASLVAPLIEAVKELKTLNDNQQKQIEAQKKEIDNQTVAINSIQKEIAELKAKVK